RSRRDWVPVLPSPKDNARRAGGRRHFELRQCAALRRPGIVRAIRQRGRAMSRYEETYRRALADPEGFWGEAAEAIDWERRWDRVLDDRNPPFYRWFSGGRLNT